MRHLAAVLVVSVGCILWLIAAAGGPIRWDDESGDDYDDSGSWGV